MNLDEAIQSISKKFTQINDLVKQSTEREILSTSLADLFNLISILKEIISISNKNLDFLNVTYIQESFQQVLQVVDSSSDSIINYLTFLTNNSITDDQIINKNINDLYRCFQIYFNNFQQIIDKYSTSESVEILQNWLGLESFLFTFCVNLQSSQEAPFFNLKIVNFYTCYEKVNSIESTVSAVTSFCGTGKTICLPIILLCRSLRECMNFPFLLLLEPNQNQATNFFKQKVSKFVSITTNKAEFLEQVKNYDEDHQSIKKIVFGIFNPYDFLCLIQEQKIQKISRFIVDEIHKRSTILDVLLTKISDYNKNNLFTIPLNVILASSSISSSLLSLFESSSINLVSFCESSQYEIVEKPPIYDHFVKKIKTEIVPNETIDIINKMASIDSEIEEGHVLCFLPGIFVCDQVKKAVISSLINDEETETKRKVVFIKAKLKHNEPIEEFYERIREEYILNEKLREVNFKHDFLYFLPLNYSGLSDESVFHLVENELPNDLRKINKLIFSTSISEPSINDKLSVVIDSGLIKENGFDYSISVRTIKDTQASKEIMNLRKGRLGRSMKGLYVPIQTEKNIPEVQTPLIQREDITKNVLLLKDINIDIESIKNLPDKPNEANIKTALENLVYIGAIDENTSKITELGHNILQFPFILIYYSAAMQIFKKEFEFNGEEEEGEEDKNSKNEGDIAFFVSGYISTVLTMSNMLVQEEMSENLSKLFVKESDIATIINALNILLKSPINENNELRNLVESYGFSYSVFCDLKSNIQFLIDTIFPSKTINEILDLADKFIENHEGILSVIDSFIVIIEQTYPNFTDSNYITFKYVNGSGGFDSNSSLVFKASENLKFPKKRQQKPEININRRPGWNGISIPTECYLFNITRNLNYNTNSGFLIHRATPESKSLISTIEIDKIALNPYFGILMETYFSDLQITRFENDPKDQPKRQYPFHYSNAGDRVFLSYISEEEESIKPQIIKGINKVIKLLPFTPRSVLILRSDGNAIVEVTSLGTQNYDASISTLCHGNFLDKKSIEYCLKNLNELAKLDSRIRICSLFVHESCELKYFDQKNLYIINDIDNRYNPPLMDIIIPQIQRINKEINQKQQLDRHYLDESPKNKKKDDLILFQFKSDFIHPSLIRIQESLNPILKWFEKFDQGKVYRVIGSQLLMNRNDAERLQAHIQNESETIKEQMNLNYVAIQIPPKIYEKTFLIIKEHPTWHYDKKYGAIVTTKEESKNVYELIESYKSELNDESESTKFIEKYSFSKAICCLLACENPDDPVLTKYPITAFFKDGSYYISKACHDCLLDNFKYNMNYLFVHGKVDQSRVENISVKPNTIPSIESFYNEEGSESWPVIPLGLMVYVLINDDDSELSTYISAWLYSIEEFTIRILMGNRFLWCNIHPHSIFDIVKLGRKLFRCKECDNEIANMEQDDEETLIRKEEKELRDRENRIFQEVEHIIRMRVEEEMRKIKFKKKKDEEERIRREIELEIRNNEQNEIRKNIIQQIEKEEKRKRLEEEKRRQIEEEKRKEDERKLRIKEERKRRFMASIQREVDAKINKMVEEQILIEQAQTGAEVDENRRKEIELEFRKNEEQMKIDIYEERKRLAEEEIRERNNRNNKKSMNFISKLKKCPRCNKPIIKNGGCNHMACRCGCHFCWICLYQSKNSSDIYKHIRKDHNGRLFD